MGGGRSKQTGHSKGANGRKKIFKTKRKHKDLDQVFDDCIVANSVGLKFPIDSDLPGDGQFFCVPCGRHFQDLGSRAHHFRSKVHKRRMKELKVTPYSVKESEAAGGVGTYVLPCKISLQDPHQNSGERIAED